MTHTTIGEFDKQLAATAHTTRVLLKTPKVEFVAAGPFIIDMPPNVRGAMSDGWRKPLPDTNKSARYLVLGPGQVAPADVAGFEVRRGIARR